MIPSGHLALIDRYVGYFAPYATSHDDLDRDTDFQDEVRNAARALVQAVKDRRSGKLLQLLDRGLHEARPAGSGARCGPIRDGRLDLGVFNAR